MNSADLFRINLPGINILLPLYLDAIEFYLRIDFPSYLHYHPEMKSKANLPAIRERFTRIRAQCIQILLSIMSLPFHYEHLTQRLFEDYLEKSHDVQTTTIITCSQYRSRIFGLLTIALNLEQDAANAQLLFGNRVDVNNEDDMTSSAHSGMIRLACSLSAHYEQEQPTVDGSTRGTKHSRTPSRSDLLASTFEDADQAVILICVKGTSDSLLFLSALDTLLSLVTDPMCQLSKNVLFSMAK